MSPDEARIQGHLRPNERPLVELEGVVAGYTRWSGLGGIVAIVSALTVPRVMNLGFVAGALSIVVVVVVVFMAVYYGIGRRLAARSEPPSESPYLTVLLTDRRVLLFDRGLGNEDLTLIEEVPLDKVSTVRYGPARPLVPQRLGFVISGNVRREFEFARSQSVQDFVEHFV